MLHVLLAFSLFSFAYAELVIPQDLTPLNSPEGQALLFGAQPRDDYFQLSQHFVTQINSAFCGIASSVTVLNALKVPRPLQDPRSELNSTRYAYFTQANVFNNHTEQVVPKAQVLDEGLSLEDLAVFLSAHQDVGSAFLHTSTNVTLEAFRSAIVQGLAAPETYVIVNFNRDALDEPGGGHHSPIAAYNPQADSLLVMDVSRYKYTAWWVPVARLYPATQAVDGRVPRGLVLAWRLSSWPNDAPSKHVFPSRTAENASPEPWQQPGEDNGRPWIAPWVTSVLSAGEEGSASEDSDFESGDWHVASWLSLLVVAVVAALVGLAGGVAWARGGLSTGWQWPQNVWQWVQGRRGGWLQVGKGERGCELETLDQGVDGIGGRSSSKMVQDSSAV
ncbi:Phytochelatin synthase-domain-containing protein [Dunaliella salina]|uniref:glutathione gamma-glutamylcysteinyltransferase n=1 Tax=Dunaliella salina TaxID=3046 RepID=A0ABQ7G2V2_DUNSA|nr:Phytochelatin synthase-domain-containing protein [Dunaliella salina]|eukprot:KAF5828933.1 Phytochelatin synthase-domain-containing protein [Dunaliella salina]